MVIEYATGILIGATISSALVLSLMWLIDKELKGLLTEILTNPAIVLAFDTTFIAFLFLFVLGRNLREAPALPVLLYDVTTLLLWYFIYRIEKRWPI